MEEEKQFSVYMPGLETEGNKLAAQKAMHSQYVLQLLQLQRRAGFLCDITINIEDKSFKAHKPLLAACSLYFRALFADGVSSQTSSLNFERLSANGFEVLLDYIYSGSLAITSDNSDQVLYAANCLQMTNVVETCLNFIRSSFQSSAGKPGQAVVITGKDNKKQLIPPQDTGIIKTMLPNGPLIVSTSTTKEIEFEKMASVQPAPLTMPAQHVPQMTHQPPALLNHTSTVGLPGASNIQPPLQHLPNKMQQPPTAVQPQVPSIPAGPQQPAQNVDNANTLPQFPLPNPSSEALTRLMPYLVAKNARRPTLSEVRQLLINGAYSEVLNDTERYVLKEAPPALIPASESGQNLLPPVQIHPAQSTESDREEHQRRTVAESTALSPDRIQVQKELPRSMVTTQPQYSMVASSSTNQATAHTGLTFHLSSAQLKARNMQPFVLINSNNNAVIPSAAPQNIDDGSGKGRAWSDDRSVEGGMRHKSTHLSGTPCSDSVTGFMPSSSTITARSGCVTPTDSTQRFLTASSPLSFTSSPRIQISPTSPDDSICAEICSPRSKWSRAQSLDYNIAVKRSDSVDRLTSRSVGSRPLDTRPGRLFPLFHEESDNPVTNKISTSFSEVGNQADEGSRDLSSQSPDPRNRISVEEATNAVGALFVRSNPENNIDKVSENSSHDESRLVIAEAKETDRDDASHTEQEDTEEDTDALLLPKEELDDFDGRFPVSDHDTASKGGNSPDSASRNEDGCETSSVKVEGGQHKMEKRTSPFSPRMSPPAKLLRVTHSSDESKQSENTTASIASSSARDSDSDESFALDLTMPKPGKIVPAHEAETRGMAGTHHPSQHTEAISAEGKHHDKNREALDTLVLLQNKINVVPPQSVFVSTTAAMDDNSLRVGFSRKPRRSSGGQTCQWPGCGRLFRHRNIYEEHRKLHEMGVPVTQLRKCYMGARVKKTARERLEEMRMDNVGAQAMPHPEDHAHENGDHPVPVPTQGRRRKSAPTPRGGPDRKRVTLKDRKEHYVARTQTWKRQDQHPGPATALSQMQHQPLLGPSLTVPMAALQSVNTNGAYAAVPQWQGAHPAPTGSVVTPSSQVFEQAVQSMAGLAPAPARRQGAVALPLPGHGLPSTPVANNAAVAATLAALGIQFPVKRAVNPPASAAQPATMTLDELRRRIALRETMGGPMPFPPNYQNLVSQALSGGQVSEAHRGPGVVPLLIAPQRTGNVDSVNGVAPSADDAMLRLNGVTVHPEPVHIPNMYHGQPPTGGHGPKCS